MHARDALPWLHVSTFILSLVLLISSVKYAEWAAPFVADRIHWIHLVFYIGTLPLLSLVQSTIQLSILHFDAILPCVYALFLSALEASGWLITATLWTRCESDSFFSLTRSSSNPLQRLPPICPQRAMITTFGSSDETTSPHLSRGLTFFKDVLAWILLLIYLSLAYVAFREVRRLWRGDDIRGKDDGGQFFELYDYESRTG